jgi:hypothetical protein
LSESPNEYEGVPATTVAVVPFVKVDFNEFGEAISIPARAFVTPATAKIITAALTKYKKTLPAQDRVLDWTPTPGGSAVTVYVSGERLNDQYQEIKGVIDKAIKPIK